MHFLLARTVLNGLVAGETFQFTNSPLIGLGTGYTDCFGEQLNCKVPDTKFFENALEAGCRLFDTAFLYGTEGKLGEALTNWFARGHLREEVYIIAKPPSTRFFCGRCAQLRREGARIEGTCKKKECVAGVMNISHAISISLRRLNLRYVDALLMHQPYEESPNSFVEQWVQMEAAVEAGKARALGLAGVGMDPMCPDPGMCWLWWSRSKSPGGIGNWGPFSNMSIWPTVVHTDGNRRELPFRRQRAEFWRMLGIRVIGGGLRRLELPRKLRRSAKKIAKERRSRGETVTVRQILLMFMSQTGLAGPGPLIPETRNISHLEENLAVLRLPPLDESETLRLSDRIHDVEQDDDFELVDDDGAMSAWQASRSCIGAAKCMD